jgi:O-antigen/teichoic acid export membrane protein
VAAVELPRFGTVRGSIIANFLGRGWSSILSVALVPIYLRFLGIEGYALVGVYTMLAMLLNLLDLGLSATITREMARYSVDGDKAQEARDLVRTLELGYWAVGIICGAAVAACSSLLARHWLNPQNLSFATIEQAITVMGLTLALQWPLSFYAGALMGLQRQVGLNVINGMSATLRGVTTVLVLIFVSSTVEAFFICQAVASGIQTFATVVYLWRSLPGVRYRARPRGSLLVGVWRFAAGISGTSVLIVALGQIDKVVLSKTLSLQHFGYYVIASTVASAISIPMVPITEALFPRLSQLVKQGDYEAIRNLYHSGCQFASFLLCPAAALIIFFSREIVWLWTGDLAAASQVSIVMSILVLGATLNYISMTMLDVLQMAYGWLRPLFYTRLAGLVVAGPLLFLLSARFGMIGAATAWLVVYVGYLTITPHFVFRRLLPHDKTEWYAKDIGVPVVVAFVSVGAWRALIPVPAAPVSMSLYLTLTFGVTSIAVLVCMPRMRAFFIDSLAIVTARSSRI